jgi:type IV secretory pathway TrbF-like protein
VELVENSHVGNEWYTTASVNGKEIEEGSSVTLKLKSSESLKLKAYAEEQDKIPESGSANATVKVSSVTKDITKSLKVKVTENRGRYSGNTAEWKFTFKVQKSK